MQWLIPHIASSDRVSSVWSSREFLYDSDNDLLYYGDGATLGGVSLATGGGGGVAAVSGTNGSFTYSTLTVGALNGITFYTSNGSLVASYNSTQFQQSSLMTNYLGTTYTSHTHSQYLNTSQSSLFQQTSNTSNITSNALNISQSSLFQQTSLMTNYLGTGATQSFRFTSNDSQLLFTSQSSLFQATSDNSLSLGTSYTSHTHSQYINTSNSSLFQQTSLMTNYLGTAATQSFRFTSNDSQLVFTSQSSLFQQTSATSAITSNAFPSAQTTKFAGTGTTLNGTNVSLSVTLNSIGLRLDASVAAPGAASLNVSAGTTSANLTALTFADSNGVSFGLNAGTITATVKTDYQSSGNYLTTARASNDAVGLNTALTGNGVSWTVNSSGISLNIPAFLTTAMQSNQSSNFVNTSQSSLFQQTSNTSNITVSALNTSQSSLFQQTSNTSNITSNALNTSQSSLFQQTSLMSDYLGTGATQSFRFTSNDSQLLFTSQSSLFQATSDNSLSLGTTYTSHTHSQYVNTSESSLFQQTSNTSAITSNALNTSQSSLFEQTSHTTVFLTSQSNQAFSAANGSQAFQTLKFVDGQGVSFSTNTNGINASVKTDYLTTAMASDAGSRFVNTSAALNLTNISATFSSNAISLSVAAPTGATYLGGIAASNTTYTSGNVSLRDLNGITFQSTTGQGIQITHALQYTSNTSAITASALNTSQSSLFQQTSNTSAITSNALHTSLSTRFAGTGTTTAGTNISLSVTLNSVGLNLAASVNPGGGGGGIALANSQTTYTSGTVNLSAAGALTIQSTTGQSYLFSVPGTSSLSGTGQLSISVNGSTVSLGVPFQAVSGTNGSFSYSTLSFGALNGITFYTSNSSIVASYTTASAAPSPVIISAGTSSASLGSIVFSDANGVQFGLSGSTITANVGASPRNYYNPYGDLVMVAGQVGQGTLNINPNVMPDMTFDRVLLPINNTNAATLSGSHTLSFWLGIYTLNVSTLSLLTSNSVSYALTHSGNAGSYSLYSGMRHASIPMSTSLSEGRYYIGVLSRTTSGGANGSYSQFLVSNLNSNFLGFFGSSHNTTMQFQPGLGVYSVTTSGIPGTIPISQVRGSDSNALRPPVLIFANSTL